MHCEHVNCWSVLPQRLICYRCVFVVVRTVCAVLAAPFFLSRYKRLRLYERLPVYEMCWERRGVWGDCWGTAEVFPVSPLPVAYWYPEWPARDWCFYSGGRGYFSNLRKLACIFTFPSQAHQHRILYHCSLCCECIVSISLPLKNH